MQAMQLFYTEKNRSMDDRVISIIPLLIQDRILISVFDKLISTLYATFGDLACIFFKCSAIVILVPMLFSVILHLFH